MIQDRGDERVAPICWLCSYARFCTFFVSDSGNVTVIDGATNLTSTLGAGTAPFAVAVNPVTNKIYLANNGGSTQTMALPFGSPAMNKIPFGTNGCGTTVTNDQRGFGRVAPCDIGAYEYALPVFLPLILK